MPVTVFKDASYKLNALISKISHGEIALPDIQRPFVWTNDKVRNLFDSMYKGFPVGYLLFWATGADAGAKQIGTQQAQSAPSLLIVDGQQRLTSLFAVLTGTPVVGKDYKASRIYIAFRPEDQTFEVADAAIRNDPEFIPDISEIFGGGFYSYVGKFLERLEQHRGVSFDDADRNRIAEAIDRVKDLQLYPFQAIELDQGVDEESVADIFVRINSEGVQLKHADFILTLMSVFWEKGRRELEEFARAAKQPSTAGPSPFNHYIDPGPDQMLRASIAVAFRRARLQAVYQLLRGKDLETGAFSSTRRDEQFAKLEAAHEAALDLHNWQEFLKCLKQAGYMSSRMVSSDTALIFTYAIWLIGRRDFGVDTQRLRRVIARWWFMAHTTGRYTGSSETQFDADLNRIKEVAPGDGDGFCALLDRTVADTFTRDYWDITLPNRLDTSSPKSPPLLAYWAALNLLDAELLFSKLKVASMLDPAISPVKNVERHHLFPRAYLESIAVRDVAHINAIANMAFVDWADNVAISAKSPMDYWPTMTANLSPETLAKQQEWHALPVGWEQLDYAEFREKRRRLIAKVVERGFRLLMDEGATTKEAADLRELIDLGESNRLEFKSTARWNLHTKDRDPKLEQVIVKTVAGFMNAEGGTLLIGVADDGSIVGLNNDYATLSKGNRDGYELFLTQLIAANITGPAAALLRTNFESIGDTDVCRLVVAASAKPVFAKPPGGGSTHTDFWVRLGNQTTQLHGTDLLDYQQQRFA